jgi:hypothetical protein
MSRRIVAASTLASAVPDWRTLRQFSIDADVDEHLLVN